MLIQKQFSKYNLGNFGNGQLENTHVENANGTQSMFALTILEKHQRNKTKIFSRKCDNFITDSKLWRSKS